MKRKIINEKFIHENNLSLDELEFSDLKLYPNQAKEFIIIQSDVVFRREVKFIIYDILGRKSRTMGILQKHKL